LVASNLLEEGNHELLVRSLAAAGDRAAALRQVAVCEDTLTAGARHRAVGSAAGRGGHAGRLAGAPAGQRPDRGHQPAGGGRAAILAGAVQAGIDCLRRACADAAGCGDPALHGQALAALGSALVHSLRGRDEEGAVVLHEAIRLATVAGDRPTAATAHRQLGFIEVQVGRRQTADAWLAKATALAETDDELAAIGGVRGVTASDMGDYPTAFRHLQDSVERGRRAGNHRQQAWSLAFLARAHLLRDERSQAAGALAGSLELVHEHRWMAFLSLPEALRGELDLRAGHLDAAGDGLEHAWTLGCQLGDPCWEGMAARDRLAGRGASPLQPGARPLPVGQRPRLGRQRRRPEPPRPGPGPECPAARRRQGVAGGTRRLA
jgi:tetratricopeptide (TPR) repeat protein